MLIYKKFFTLGEEIFNAVTHGVGAALAIAATVLLLIRSASIGALAVVSCAIYGASLIILYTMSTLYHALSARTAKAVMRIFDHCTIFVLIAGTYTPFCLILLDGAWGWSIFGAIWGLTALGITLNAINLEKYKVFSMIAYIAMGWCVLLVAGKVIAALGFWGTTLLLSGGIAYTAGIGFFASKKKYFHSIWHFFVLAGSILHFFTVYFFVL
ncbi:MAG: hemolysin III family protein [Clostridia bacterium]|nr:hemolysin III family protein [Clostridia bacterium]